MLNLLPYLTKLNESIQKVDRRISKYVKDPNEKQIHDLRTSIRRFDAAYTTLPKKNRVMSTNLSQYVLECKKLFKVNSEIRDLDIIQEKLQNYVNDAQKEIIEQLKATRQTRLEHAKEIALSLKNTDRSKLLDRIDVTEKDLQKRYNKILSQHVSKIEAAFPVVITNSSKLEELHGLRKDCKKLRYILELQPEENKESLQMRKILQKIQDILGSIHDFDFTIVYLESLGLSSKEIQDIKNAESEGRRLKYEEFLRFCRRRLHIASNSFLIRIKTLIS
ncbi:MAG TPA: CHAD domain-containing protein [Nitrososphaeraceae archaeon]